jgi:hypothetical protein
VTVVKGTTDIRFGSNHQSMSLGAGESFVYLREGTGWSTDSHRVIKTQTSMTQRHL